MNYKLISTKNLVARLKEEMRSYFNTGAIDDLLFNIWILDCIAKFENTYRPIQPAVLDLYGNKCPLPCDFHSVQEVWLCATIDKGPIKAPGQFYYQTDCRINPAPAAGEACGPCVDGYQCFTGDEIQQPVGLPSLCDVPEQYRVTHKVNTWMNFSYTVSCMLKPGNFKTIGKCNDNCANLNLNTYTVDTFDIIGDNLVTSFFSGTVYLAYYGDWAIVPEDEGPDAGYYMIPDNKPFYDYVYHYLRFMIYQQLFDQSTDETFNQIMAKRNDAEDKYWMSYNNARAYSMSPDIYGIQKSIVRSYNKNNRYLLRGPATRR